VFNKGFIRKAFHSDKTEALILSSPDFKFYFKTLLMFMLKVRFRGFLRKTFLFFLFQQQVPYSYLVTTSSRLPIKLSKKLKIQ
jgi:hypothetical protein